MYDSVHNPKHYCDNPCGFEPIEITQYMSLCIGSAFAYIFRSKKKGSYIEDLQKSMWYLDREVMIIEEMGGAPLRNERAQEKIKSVYLRAHFDQSDREMVLCEELILFELNGLSTFELKNMRMKIQGWVNDAIALKKHAFLGDLDSETPKIEEVQRIVAADFSVGAGILGEELGRASTRMITNVGIHGTLSMDAHNKKLTEPSELNLSLYSYVLCEIVKEVIVTCSILGTDLESILDKILSGCNRDDIVKKQVIYLARSLHERRE